MVMGPAGEILARGNRAAHMPEPAKPALRDGRAEPLTAGGVRVGAPIWMVTCVAHCLT
jgi:hypothetical protein